jgi:thiamine pyrophosphate-dependent acetolactate synthase large subunit-like protein
MTGRPGPVLVDVTKDCQQNSAPYIWPPKVELLRLPPGAEGPRQVDPGGGAASPKRSVRSSTRVAV